ncbi:MAG: sensor histidine kinase [Planctomycetota bacterium]|nr:MAG: sensor histidine kinase [Planctomycetota bacterium]
MPPSPSSRSLLLLDPDPDGPLAKALRALLPRADLRVLPPTADWPPRAEGCDLVVLRTNRADLSSLRLLHHILRRNSALQAVLVVGDRGLAGAEPLLGLPNVRFLPEPWTPRGLEQVVLGRGRVQGADDAELLSGLVEGLRDPLASLSGYLQLLRGEAPAADEGLVGPALDSARELDRLLAALELATSPSGSHRELVDGKGVAQRLFEQARRGDDRLRLEWEGPTVTIEVDLRRLEAALHAGRLLLERFGPGGDLVLRGGIEEGHARLYWLAAEEGGETAPAAEAVRPPGFLAALLARLAAQLGAQPLLRWRDGAVPVAAGLSWPPPRS